MTHVYLVSDVQLKLYLYVQLMADESSFYLLAVLFSGVLLVFTLSKRRRSVGMEWVGGSKWVVKVKRNSIGGEVW